MLDGFVLPLLAGFLAASFDHVLVRVTAIGSALGVGLGLSSPNSTFRLNWNPFSPQPFVVSCSYSASAKLISPPASGRF